MSTAEESGHAACEAGVAPAARWAGLVAAVAKGRDPEAFARLFDHFAPRLHAYLIRLGAPAPEEITQEVMLVLWRKAALFEPEKSSVATWLYRIARNRRIDGLRRDRLDLVDLDASAFQSPDATDLDREADQTGRNRAVRSALTRLPEDQSRLVRLAFFDELSHSEIARSTGLPLGTVKSRMRLAFARLRRALETQGVTEAG